MLLVMLGWVFFRAADVHHAIDMLRAAAFMTDAQSNLATILSPDRAFYLSIGVALSFVPLERFASWTPAGAPLLALSRATTVALFLFTAAALSTATFSPFIYFRF